MGKNFYAVRKGIKPGIYGTWDECRAMVEGVSRPEFKKFSSLEEAEAFMNEAAGGSSLEADDADKPYAFVDGSFNIKTGVYGYGGFLVHQGKREVLKGSGSEKEMASMRNVAGEVLGSRAAIEKALELGIPELTIYYDYNGIEMWATGKWKRNKAGTIAYYDYVQSVKDRIELNFKYVKGHSGVEGNEEADRLAKEAVGINCIKS